MYKRCIRGVLEVYNRCIRGVYMHVCMYVCVLFKYICKYLFVYTSANVCVRRFYSIYLYIYNTDASGTKLPRPTWR